MDYDIDWLSRDLGYGTKELEKVLGITDVLEGISNVEFLKERLSCSRSSWLRRCSSPGPRRLGP